MVKTSAEYPHENALNSNGRNAEAGESALVEARGNTGAPK